MHELAGPRSPAMVFSTFRVIVVRFTTANMLLSTP